MRVPWKLVGLAGLAGVAATGAMVARRRRNQRDYEPDELRRRLHERLAEANAGRGQTLPFREGSDPSPVGLTRGRGV